MNVIQKVSLRYMRAKSNNSFISLISGFSVAGVALGVATLIVTISVMNGFESALKNRLASGEFHILITKKMGNAFFAFDQEQVANVFEQSKDVLAVSPVLQTEAIIRAGKRVSGVSVRGISELQMKTIAASLVEAVDDAENKIVSKNGIWLGKEIAYQLNLLPGEKVSLISPTETEGPMGSVPRLRRFRVEGIYESGVPEKDAHVVYVPLAAVQEFMQRESVVNQVELSIRHFEESTPIAEKIRALLGPEFRVQDWNQLNTQLFSALALERVVMFIVLAMIIVVASFNIVTSLTMLVIDKRKDISIMQAMGATGRQIGRIFLLHGAMIGNIGTLIGFVLGMSICLILKNYQFIQLPDIFFDRTLPVVISPINIFGIVLTAVIIVIIAAWIPARSAAKLTPIEGFREVS